MPLGLVILLPAFFLGVVLLLHRWYGVPVGDLTRDPAAVIGFPFYIGILSNVGIMMWTAAAAVCLFSAALLIRSPAHGRVGRFLAVSGLFTLVLALDDLFLLHEDAFPRYLGIPEAVALSAYLIFGLGYLVWFRDVLRPRCRLLAAALFFFALSFGADMVTGLLSGHEARVAELPAAAVDYYFLFEDGTKFIGITLWFAYFTQLSLALLQPRTSHAAAGRTGEGTGGLTGDLVADDGRGRR